MIERSQEQGKPATLEERLADLERRVTDLEALSPAFQEPEDCRMHTCGYFQMYLAQGPAHLGHEGFHAAESRCEFAQAVYMRHLHECAMCNGGEIDRCGVEKALRRIAESKSRKSMSSCRCCSVR